MFVLLCDSRSRQYVAYNQHVILDFISSQNLTHRKSHRGFLAKLDGFSYNHTGQMFAEILILFHSRSCVQNVQLMQCLIRSINIARSLTKWKYGEKAATCDCIAALRLWWELYYATSITYSVTSYIMRCHLITCHHFLPVAKSQNSSDLLEFY